MKPILQKKKILLIQAFVILALLCGYFYVLGFQYNFTDKLFEDILANNYEIKSKTVKKNAAEKVPSSAKYNPKILKKFGMPEKEATPKVTTYALYSEGRQFSVQTHSYKSVVYKIKLADNGNYFSLSSHGA